MENNEQETVEETVDTASGAEQTELSQEETIKNLEGQVAKYKAISERKDKKLQAKPQEEETKKTNSEQGGPTMEHMALFGQGATLEEVNYAEKIATLEGTSLTEAFNSDIAQDKFARTKKEAQLKANGLGASKGSPNAAGAKSSGQMTDDEHRAFAEGKLSNAINA